MSNGKKKAENNGKCGNKYLAWAFVEAANFAQRHDPACRQFYDRKKAQGQRDRGDQGAGLQAGQGGLAHDEPEHRIRRRADVSASQDEQIALGRAGASQRKGLAQSPRD
jgi:hypothetical protein